MYVRFVPIIWAKCKNSSEVQPVFKQPQKKMFLPEQSQASTSVSKIITHSSIFKVWSTSKCKNKAPGTLYDRLWHKAGKSAPNPLFTPAFLLAFGQRDHSPAPFEAEEVLLSVLNSFKTLKILKFDRFLGCKVLNFEVLSWTVHSLCQEIYIS